MCPARFVCTKGRMNPSDENRLAIKLEYIKSEIDAGYLLDTLVRMEIFSIDDTQAIRNRGGRNERNQAFMDMLFERGLAAYNAFIEALNQNGYCHVASKIEQDACANDKAEGTARDLSKTMRELEYIRASVNKIETNVMALTTSESETSKEQSTNVVVIKESELNQLNQDLLAKETEVQRLRGILNDKEFRLNDALDEITKLKATVLDPGKTCREQKRRMSEMHITITCHENELKKQEQLLHQHQVNIDRQNYEIKELSENITNQREAITRQAKEIEFLHDIKTTQGNKIREIEERNNELRITLTRERKLFDEQGLTLNNLRIKLSQQEKLVSSLKRNGQQKELKLEEQRTLLAGQRELIDYQKKVIEFHEDTIRNMQEVAKKQENKLETQKKGDAIRDLQKTVGGIQRRDVNTKEPKWRY